MLIVTFCHSTKLSYRSYASMGGFSMVNLQQIADRVLKRPNIYSLEIEVNLKLLIYQIKFPKCSWSDLEFSVCHL